MQVSIDTTGPLERRVSVQVAEENIAAAVQERLRSLARTSRIAGFRPGKAPLRVVEQHYATRVRDEVVGDLLRTSFRDAVVQEKLRPAGDPTIDPFKADPGSGLSYSATFEVYPEITLDKVKGIALERATCDVGQADIDKMVDTLRRQARRWTEVSRPAATGDRVVIDYRGQVDGVALEGGSREGFELELGSSTLIPSFEDGLVGGTAGSQRVLDLSFPDPYSRAELAGKPVHFEVDIKSVKQGELPALDDDFFARYGVASGGMDAFLAEVRGNMEREMARALRQRTHGNVMKALFDAHDFEIPRALIAAECERMLQGLRQRLSMQGAAREDLERLQPAMMETEARRRVAIGLYIGEVVRSNALAADPGLVRSRVEGLAASYENPAAVAKWYYEDRNRLGEIEASVLEDVAVAWVLEHAQVTERPVTFDALMNPVQTGTNAQEPT